MTNSLIITYQVLDIRDPDDRSKIQDVLADDAEQSFYQANGTVFPSDALLKALNAFTNEDEAADLSLDQLEELAGGVGLPEAMVSSTILMVMVSGAFGCFANSMGAVNNSQIQDALNAGIHANIEEVRNDLANHNFDSSTGTYQPTVASNIGQDFLSSSGYIDDDGNSTNGIQTKIPLGNETVTRIIEADGNSITVTYTYEETSGSSSGSTSTLRETSMVAPAAGWLS